MAFEDQGPMEERTRARASDQVRVLPVAIDHERLEGLVRGQSGALEEIAAVFAETMPRLIAALGRAIEKKDAAAVCRLAHSIKGSSATVGAMGLAGLSHDLELMGRAGEVDNAILFLPKVEQEYARASAELDALAAGDAPASRT